MDIRVYLGVLIIAIGFFVIFCGVVCFRRGLAATLGDRHPEQSSELHGSMLKDPRYIKADKIQDEQNQLHAKIQAEFDVINDKIAKGELSGNTVFEQYKAKHIEPLQRKIATLEVQRQELWKKLKADYFPDEKESTSTTH